MRFRTRATSHELPPGHAARTPRGRTGTGATLEMTVRKCVRSRDSGWRNRQNDKRLRKKGRMTAVEATDGGTKPITGSQTRRQASVTPRRVNGTTELLTHGLFASRRQERCIEPHRKAVRPNSIDHLDDSHREQPMGGVRHQKRSKSLRRTEKFRWNGKSGSLRAYLYSVRRGRGLRIS